MARASTVVSLLVLLLTSCDSNWASSGPIDRAALVALPTGSSARVSDLIGAEIDRVCALGPYEDRLSEEEWHAGRVNAHLRSIRYTADEHRWAFLLIGEEQIEIASFDRSAELDLMSAYEAGRSRVDGLPQGFAPSVCARAKFAAFAKTADRDRAYVLLGELQ